MRRKGLRPSFATTVRALAIGDQSKNPPLALAIADRNPTLLWNVWGMKQNDFVNSRLHRAPQACENWMGRNAAQNAGLADFGTQRQGRLRPGAEDAGHGTTTAVAKLTQMETALLRRLGGEQ